ncbi:MAG TPA: DUF192 domain-containing protein [Turneriella sp.]|nr:DUF192 domain-containing protein [Turneriella sp.]
MRRFIRIFFFFCCTPIYFSLAADSWKNEWRQEESPSKENRDKSKGSDRLVKELDEVWRVVFKNAKGEDVVLDCEVARSEKDKERGLMFRKFLGKNRGMIFVYEEPHEMRFWMQNTVLPLSIAFIHSNLFISSLHDMKPMSLDIVASEVPTLYAIEANQGWFKTNTILPGNRLTIYKKKDEYKIKRTNKYRQALPEVK